MNAEINELYGRTRNTAKRLVYLLELNTPSQIIKNEMELLNKQTKELTDKLEQAEN